MMGGMWPKLQGACSLRKQVRHLKRGVEDRHTNGSLYSLYFSDMKQQPSPYKPSVADNC
jgi:hypothetical protein